MKRLPAWGLPVVSFAVAAVLSIVAEGHLSILSRIPAQTTPLCQATLNPFCVAGAVYSITFSAIKTTTWSNVPGNTVIGPEITFSAFFNYTLKNGGGGTEILDTFTYDAPSVSGPTAAGQGILTNYNNSLTSETTLVNTLVSDVISKYSKPNNPVTSVTLVRFQPVFSTELLGVWKGCKIIQLGPSDLNVTLNANGTGNACQ